VEKKKKQRKNRWFLRNFTILHTQHTKVTLFTIFILLFKLLKCTEMFLLCDVRDDLHPNNNNNTTNSWKKKKKKNLYDVIEKHHIFIFPLLAIKRHRHEHEHGPIFWIQIWNRVITISVTLTAMKKGCFFFFFFNQR
jgi:hypothetical protein